MGVSAPSLHIESTDSMIYIYIYIYTRVMAMPKDVRRNGSAKNQRNKGSIYETRQKIMSCNRLNVRQ